ncbi:LINE-1 retrotransposable element ORF2 protein [Bienertia sinuspersici]
MARKSKKKSGSGKKTSRTKTSKNKEKIEAEEETISEGISDVENEQEEHANPNGEEDEICTPKSSMIRAQQKNKYDFTEWMNSLREKHPISKLNEMEQDDGRLGEVPMHTHDEEIPCITVDDIQPEVEYWKSSIVGFVIGANPPGNVMDGFFRRIWKDYGVDKVITIERGTFLIRFNSMEQRDKILTMGRVFFDQKPVILRPWHIDMDLNKEDIQRIPIWVKLNLHFKYWGQNCLKRIIQPVGTLIKVDSMTANRDKLQYARCMIEVKIDQEFPEEVRFKNERNEIVNVNISYEWKPETCKKCKKLGHDENQCYIRVNTVKVKKIWQQKGLTQQDAGTGCNEETRTRRDVEVQQYKEGGQPPLKSQLEEPRNPRLTGAMFKVSQKLKKVKNSLKELNKMGFNNLQAEDTRTYQELVKIQEALHKEPLNTDLMQKEKEAAINYNQAHGSYMQYLRQKAKATWIREGIQDAFVDYYKDLLGKAKEGRTQVHQKIIQKGPVLQEDQRRKLIQPFTKEEVRKAIFSIPGNKSPGPDGFGTHFYKHNWGLIGEEVSNAILDFFETGKLLKEINNTLLVLIPKVAKPLEVSEFRPIACCNTIYKGITKLLCSRLKEVLPDLVSENQGAFVHDRYIVHNIMVCQDLVRRYGRKNNSPSCMIKLDLKKAYDTVEWSFLEEMLRAMCFPNLFIDWIMECITSPRFSLVLNGSPTGYFKSCRGLRQGDPLSPLLFVLGMEYLSRILNNLHEDSNFNFHPRCKGIRLTHMCFADDLIMCCKGEKKSVDALLKCFNEFSSTSGLQANNSKTELYTSGMKEVEVNQVLNESGFKKGRMPFKYLGVPICSKRVNASQCEVLIEKMTARIRTWSSRHISFAGRSQLINSVLMSIQQYWAQVFILPTSVLQSIEQICRSYLWSGHWCSNRPGYIAWENVCRPKKEGGLGFKSMQQWNLANMGRYVWAVEQKQDSLWLKWVNSVYIKGQEWWNYRPPTDASWYWKKVCETKEKMKGAWNQRELKEMRKYKVSKIYYRLKDHSSPKPWAENIWSRHNIPKYSFCTWLAIQKRLPTADRLKKMGNPIDNNCPLCTDGEETSEHLFFECSYSKGILEELKLWMGIPMTSTQLQNILKGIRRKGRALSLQKEAWNSVITAAVFLVWQIRNEVRHGKEKKEWKWAVEQAKYQVKIKLNMKDRSKMSEAQLLWLDNI